MRRRAISRYTPGRPKKRIPREKGEKTIARMLQSKVFTRETGCASVSGHPHGPGPADGDVRSSATASAADRARSSAGATPSGPCRAGPRTSRPSGRACHPPGGLHVGTAARSFGLARPCHAARARHGPCRLAADHRLWTVTGSDGDCVSDVSSPPPCSSPSSSSGVPLLPPRGPPSPAARDARPPSPAPSSRA